MSEKTPTSVSFRERAKIVSGALIEVASPLLKDVVDYADNIFWRCVQAAERPDREDHPPLVLYRHAVEMTDGIQVLVSAGCSGPTEPLLRSCFEAWLSLNYIMERNYEDRSLAWLCSYIHSEINQKEMLDRDTKKGQALASALEREAPEILEKLRPAKDMVNLQEALTEPRFGKIESEYQRRKRKHKYPYWCSLVGGPTSFPELAKCLSRGAPYHVWYGPWSGLIHGFDASRFFAELPDGTVEFRALRDPKGLQKSACLAICFVNNVTKLMIRKFVPHEALNFFKWESAIIQRLDRLERFKLKAT